MSEEKELKSKEPGEMVEEQIPMDKTVEAIEDANASKEEVTTEIPAIQKPQTKEGEETEDLIKEIDNENAKDAEDKETKDRHEIPLLDYHEMSMENLVGEMQRAGGGNEIDFHYNSVTKKQFNEVYKTYREKRSQYYKSRENTLKENLAERLSIIEELKGLVSVEEDMNTTYNNFKTLQQNWRSAGPIPRAQYNDVWRTYQHHTEMFYDFLHLNRELRDLDFKHNLEEKTKLVERAEALANEKNLSQAFRDLQTLHKLWKEEIGPVANEHRDAIWDRFSNATKVMHNRRQEHQKELDKKYEANLAAKNELIMQINTLAENTSGNHKTLQQQIKQVSELREQFFKAGKVPQKVNESTV